MDKGVESDFCGIYLLICSLRPASKLLLLESWVRVCIISSCAFSVIGMILSSFFFFQFRSPIFDFDFYQDFIIFCNRLLFSDYLGLIM